jgi:hypothetical protein
MPAKALARLRSTLTANYGVWKRLVAALTVLVIVACTGLIWRTVSSHWRASERSRNSGLVVQTREVDVHVRQSGVAEWRMGNREVVPEVMRTLKARDDIRSVLGEGGQVPSLMGTIESSLNLFFAGSQEDHASYLSKLDGRTLPEAYVGGNTELKARYWAAATAAIQHGNLTRDGVEFRIRSRQGGAALDSEQPSGSVCFACDPADMSGGDIVEVIVKLILQDTGGNSRPARLGLWFARRNAGSSWILFGQCYYDLPEGFQPVYLPI